VFTNPFVLDNIIPVLCFALTYLISNSLYSNEKFLSILRPDGKKHFGEIGACSNLVKTLQCITALIGLTYYYITDIRHGNYPDIPMRSLSMNLVAVELLSIIKASKYYLRKDTIYHHCGVIFFGTLSLAVNFNSNKPAQCQAGCIFIDNGKATELVMPCARAKPNQTTILLCQRMENMEQHQQGRCKANSKSNWNA
jgi:hypothetical protein